LGPKDLSQDPGDVREILDFYFRVQDPNETELIYEAKFLIIGEGGAGKTSLAKKIENESYDLQSNEKSTEGIDVIAGTSHSPTEKIFASIFGILVVRKSITKLISFFSQNVPFML
jgi:GTPase SAR1 family protein